MNKKRNAEDLLHQYKNGTCSPEERAIVESWHLKTLRESGFMPDAEELEQAGQAIWNALPIHQEQPKPQLSGNPVPLWIKYIAAASIFLTMSIGLYLLIQPAEKQVETIAQRYKNDIQPGGNKAILTLADGNKVILDDAQAGLLAHEGEANINKSNDGGLVYTNDQQTGKNAVTNKLAIPVGGQYHLTLPDGTKVWLNSSSTLTYPTAFTGTKRMVELSGEAYFEVTKDKKHPFTVQTNKQSIEVLGTHFNVYAYTTEEQTKTTLLEGSVKVIYQSKDYLLKPGQQASVGNTVAIAKVDTQEAIDWKDGNFNFNDKDIKSIMRLLARWYNIEVVYEGQINNIGFGAEISRDKSLSQVLKVLEQTGAVRFRIEGRRVTVMQ